MNDTTKWLSKPGNAAAAGATAALVMAMFTPAIVLLGVGGAIATGAYLWNKNKQESGDDESSTDSDSQSDTGNKQGKKKASKQDD